MSDLVYIYSNLDSVVTRLFDELQRILI
jgi:hypothetical protein